MEVDIIKNVEHIEVVGYPEWIVTEEKAGKVYLSTSDDSALRFRLENSEFDQILFFKKSSPILYHTDKRLFYNREDLLRIRDTADDYKD